MITFHNTEMGLEAGKTYDMEFGIKDNEGNIAGSKLHAFVKLNHSDWTEARIWEFEANINSEPLFHGGFGTEIAVNSANAIVLETSEATCDHEISGWSEPDEKSEIYRSCKKCGIIMERSYCVNVVDFSTLTGEDSALLGGKGVLGELADRQAVAVKARVYLPKEEKFNFRFALFGDGKTYSDFGDLYGSFIYVFSEGSVEVKYPDGDTVDSVSCPALKAGETVCIEFGVYAMNDAEREFYVKVNDEKVLSGKGVDDNEPLGTSVTYNFIGAALTESATSACEHKEGEHSEPDESGFADVACGLCGKVLYRSHAQEVRDISEYIGNDAVLLEADRKVSYDLKADEYVALKGIMHIPEEAGNDFGIKFHLMSDAMAWQGSASERFEGMFTWVLQNGDSTKATLYPSFPWAYGFYVGKDCSNDAIRAGSTFMFEVGVYRISSDYTVRTTYFKINGETVGEFSRFDNSNAYGSYIYLETDCDIVLTTAGSECSDGVHSIGNWSEADSSFKQKKTCEKCGKEIIEREVASNVRFSSNPIGLVRLDEMQAIGETFTYDIPIITGYKISGITVNGTDVTSSAEALPYKLLCRY